MKRVVVFAWSRRSSFAAVLFAAVVLTGCDAIERLKNRGKETASDAPTATEASEAPPPTATGVATGVVASAGDFGAGDKVQVKWQGAWYPAVVKSVRAEKYHIHYTGWSTSWDEWVGSDRIRAANAGKVAALYQKGAKVKVLWKGRWYPATVLAVTENGYRIHYDGWGAQWDEWASPARVRDR